MKYITAHQIKLPHNNHHIILLYHLSVDCFWSTNSHDDIANIKNITNQLILYLRDITVAQTQVLVIAKPFNTANIPKLIVKIIRYLIDSLSISIFNSFFFQARYIIPTKRIRIIISFHIHIISRIAQFRHNLNPTKVCKKNCKSNQTKKTLNIIIRIF